jgi:hypothetical protein
MLSNKIVTWATIIVYYNSFDQKQVVLYTDTLECRLLLNTLPQLMSGISSSSVSSLSGKWGEAKMHHTVLIRAKIYILENSSLGNGANDA